MVTTMKAGPRNDAHYWRSALIPGADMVTARFTDHAYSPHWHEAYTISLIEGGAERYDYRGTRHVADAGSLPIINPGEIHTGSSAADAGWQCRTFYLPTGFVRQVADEAGLAGTEPPWFGSDIIRDPDLARRALRAHRALEAGADRLAAESMLLDAVSTLLVRYAQARPPSRPIGQDGARVARMKARMLDDLTASVGRQPARHGIGDPPGSRALRRDARAGRPFLDLHPLHRRAGRAVLLPAVSTDVRSAPAGPHPCMRAGLRRRHPRIAARVVALAVS
ncbi:AraC family ligand binding domain-containing protein [Burkholderia gladioli]|uniref:AraC family ligand binding domain-containing protein n=1 Tax=Burkholderia gladioli TaxID=28095 RepID=UPI001FC7D038|nr:AraC family ligand binding domain-containing protein [Burkholderia gladioli]